MTREAVRLQGRLTGSKRKRNENDDDVVPLTNGVASKSRDNDDSDEEESRVKAVSKEKPKSVFDKFPVPVTNKKKQSKVGTLTNGAVVAPTPTTALPTPTEPALSKACSPGASSSGVPILFPTASSKGTPVPHRTPSPSRSTSTTFGGSRMSRSISKAARRSLKQRAIFGQGRLEIVDLKMPARTETSGVTTDPPSPPKHEVDKGKGKEKETHVDRDAHAPLIKLGIPKARGKPHNSPPREDDPVVSPTTPHPPHIRQSLPNGSVARGKSVLQLGPITPTTQPNQELGSPKNKKHKRKRKKKKRQQVDGDANAEEAPKTVAMDNSSGKKG